MSFFLGAFDGLVFQGGFSFVFMVMKVILMNILTVGILRQVFACETRKVSDFA